MTLRNLPLTLERCRYVLNINEWDYWALRYAFNNHRKAQSAILKLVYKRRQALENSVCYICYGQNFLMYYGM